MWALSGPYQCLLLGGQDCQGLKVSSQPTALFSQQLHKGHPDCTGKVNALPSLTEKAAGLP